MPRLFSGQVIDEVLDRSNIVELISSYLPLKRAGRNYKANCPFHQEKTPSFIVSADKQIFHCFGCGAGGNAISFIMQYEKVNFREALETLAHRSGIPLPEPDRNDFQKARDDLKNGLYDLYEKASAFYRNNLMNASDAQAARAYLHKRGISKETARRFNLGYARPGWDSLIQHLRGLKVSLSLIEKSGLVASKDEGGYYDRFRDRIMFPISDMKERVIGFGARVMDETMPKYINSPETPIYSKGKNLFGLTLSRDSIRSADKAIVVEGYLDMILPFEAGIKNIVASLGTALTAEQIRLLKRYASGVIMLYDADAAGQAATLRALELLIQEDVDARIAGLPLGEDPDSYVRKFGAEAFLKMVDSALSIFDYKLQYLLSAYGVRSTAAKDKIIRHILPTIKKFKNHAIRAEYIKKASERLQLDEKALLEDLKNTPDGCDEPQDEESAAAHHYRLTQIPITERMLVKLMLDEMHLVDHLRTLIDPSDFVEERLRKIVQFIFNFFAEGRECKPNILMNYLGDEEAIHIISELAALDIHDCPNKERLIVDCVKRLKRDKIIYRCQELHRQIVSAQAAGNHEALDNLIGEYNALIKQRSQFHGETCS